jgi:hypothetical protein
MEVDCMLTGHRSAWRRRNSKMARIAVPLAIPVALGLTLGVILAVNGGTPSTAIKQSAAGATATPSASASGSAAATAPAAAAANVNCELIVPANPLTAQGLATPYQLTGQGGMTPQQSGCTMANAANLGAFVQATILDPATGQLSVYEPLVITQGTQPAAAPVVPTLPANAVVNIMFGFNGTDLMLANAPGTNSLAQGNCVNGLNGSDFGQVSYCNSVNFYNAANQANLTIPALGTSTNGQPCPTTRSFNLIDQDQSDNVTTQYLVNGNGQTAQDNTTNAAAMAGSQVVSNGSDDALLDGFVDPAIGCTPFTAPDLSNGGAAGTSQTLNELMAAKDQQAPIALVPLNDPMTLLNNAFSLDKTNLYRAGVDQTPETAANMEAANNPDSPANYCANMLNNQTKFINDNRANFINKTSPVPATGNNLFTFLAARLSGSFTNLNCANFGLKNTVNLTLDGNGVAIDATLNVMTQNPASQTPMPAAGTAPSAAASAAPSAGASAAPSAGATTGTTGNTTTTPQQNPKEVRRHHTPATRGR